MRRFSRASSAEPPTQPQPKPQEPVATKPQHSPPLHSKPPSAASGLKLEPIHKPTMAATGAAGGPGAAGLPLPPRVNSLQNMTRSRRASQDEIRALLARTSQALDKIVSIRESMEDVVDFKQFDKKPRRSAHRTPSRLSSGVVEVPEHPSSSREGTASSYGSTGTSSLSDDLLADRSTNSTTNSSSSLEDTGEHEPEAEQHGSGQQLQSEPPSPASSDSPAHEEVDTFEEQDPTSSSIESSLSSGVGELTPLKEARLERLKNITISFHEGLPKEFFQALCRFLNSALEVKTRHSRFNFYKEAFTGGDCVREMLLSGFAEDHQAATRFGNVLVRLGFIEHVSRTDDQLHNSKDNFYRFTKMLEYDDASEGFSVDSATRRRTSINANNYRESVLSRESTESVEYDFASSTDEVHALVTDEVLHILAKVLHQVFERKNKLLFYKGFAGCFLGAEAVNVMREMRVAGSLIDAVLIGQCLLDEGLIEPIATSVTTFQDKYVFYRLTKAQP